MPRPYIVSQRRGDPLGRPGRSCRRARSCPEQTNREAGLGNCGRRGAPPDEGEACLAPTLCPNVGATHWVALGRSCRRARSCPEQTNREAGLGNCGRRGAPPDEGEACLAPTLCPNVGATHWVALGRSCRRARSCSEQTNREAGLGNCGRRGAPPDEGEACLAPTLCPNVGATHWVALGRSCRRARSCPEQTNREAGLGNCGRRGAPPDEGEAVPRPYIVSQRRGDPLGRPRSFMPTRSFVPGTNKSRGGPGKLWAARGAAG